MEKIEAAFKTEAQKSKCGERDHPERAMTVKWKGSKERRQTSPLKSGHR